MSLKNSTHVLISDKVDVVLDHQCGSTGVPPFLESLILHYLSRKRSATVRYLAVNLIISQFTAQPGLKYVIIRVVKGKLYTWQPHCGCFFLYT